jgi:hypothetical protein
MKNEHFNNHLHTEKYQLKTSKGKKDVIVIRIDFEGLVTLNNFYSERNYLWKTKLKPAFKRIYTKLKYFNMVFRYNLYEPSQELGTFTKTYPDKHLNLGLLEDFFKGFMLQYKAKKYEGILINYFEFYLYEKNNKNSKE